jgi:hypothetical protein
MKEHLKSVGFSRCSNENKDCYKAWDATDTSVVVPVHDVLLTNPPFSHDHIPRLLHYCTVIQVCYYVT